MDLSTGYDPNPRSLLQKVQLPAFLGLSVFLIGDAAGADFTFNLNQHPYIHRCLENVRTAQNSPKQLVVTILKKDWHQKIKPGSWTNPVLLAISNAKSSNLLGH